MEAIPDSHLDLFAVRAIWHVATIGPSGRPHVSPVWADFDGTHVRFPHSINRQKWKNLKIDDRIALSATDPQNPERYLEIRGRVVVWEYEGALDFLDRMATKYRGQTEFPRTDVGPLNERVTAVVEPNHFTAMG